MYYFLAAFLLSIIFTLAARRLAAYFGVFDRPDLDRKLHGRMIPLLGGLALWPAFWVPIIWLLARPIRGVELISNSLGAAMLVSFILLLIGLADEIRPFSAKWRLFMVAGALALLIGFGIGLQKITNPFGGYFVLPAIVGSLLVWAWLLGVTYTVKLLDGLDGLAGGIVAIGSLMIYLLTSFTKYYQPNVGLVALILLGVCLGFLIFNFYPAKIYLGESGSLFLGFMIGFLGILGGGKLATTLLVFAVPILDVARVMFVRWRKGQSIFKGDREHLHFKLMDLGLGHRQTVLIMYAVAAAFGVMTLFLQSKQKLLALVLLLFVMIVVGWKLSLKAAV